MLLAKPLWEHGLRVLKHTILVFADKLDVILLLVAP